MKVLTNTHHRLLAQFGLNIWTFAFAVLKKNLKEKKKKNFTFRKYNFFRVFITGLKLESVRFSSWGKNMLVLFNPHLDLLRGRPDTIGSGIEQVSGIIWEEVLIKPTWKRRNRCHCSNCMVQNEKAAASE